MVFTEDVVLTQMIRMFANVNGTYVSYYGSCIVFLFFCFFKRILDHALVHVFVCILMENPTNANMSIYDLISNECCFCTFTLNLN